MQHRMYFAASFCHLFVPEAHLKAIHLPRYPQTNASVDSEGRIIVGSSVKLVCADKTKYTVGIDELNCTNYGNWTPSAEATRCVCKLS